MAEAYMGAHVQYCGHDGWFLADIFDLGDMNAVKANLPKNGRGISGETIKRTSMHLITHEVHDFPVMGFWCPERGVFVVPKNQVRERPGIKEEALKRIGR